MKKVVYYFITVVLVIVIYSFMISDDNSYKNISSNIYEANVEMYDIGP